MSPEYSSEQVESNQVIQVTVYIKYDLTWLVAWLLFKAGQPFQHSVVLIRRLVLLLTHLLGFDPSEVPEVRGNTYQQGYKFPHNTGALSMKWLPVLSFLFYLTLFRFLQGRVSTVILFVPLLPGDSRRCFFLFWYPSSRYTSFVSKIKSSVAAWMAKGKKGLKKTNPKCEWCHI